MKKDKQSLRDPNDLSVSRSHPGDPEPEPARREAALRDNEEKYRQLQEIESDAILFLEDGSNHILDANPAACTLYGYTRHELPGMKLSELSARQTPVSKMPFDNKPTPPVLYHQKKDRTIFPVEVINRPFLWHGRKVRFARVRAITERHIISEGPGEQQSFLRRIIDSDPTLLYVKDKQGRIVFANRSLAEFFGIPAEELIGKTVFECTWDKEAAGKMYRDDLKILSNEVDKIERECRFRDKSGCDQWVYVMKIPMRDKDGNVEQIIGVSVVMTEHKMLEKTIAQGKSKLLAKTRELEDTNTTLKVLLKRLEQDKKDLMENIMVNIKELILPCVQKLESSRLDELQKTYVDLLKSGLAEIGSPFMKEFPLKHTNLSVMEMRIAKLIKAGKGSKEIAQILTVSLNTVMTHRYHLRTKLGVKGKKVNLRSHLNSVQF